MQPSRKWALFRCNRRAWYSLWIFGIIFSLSIFSELIANDRPLLVQFRGAWVSPLVQTYPETYFGGEFETEADYRDPFVQKLIEPEGRIIWPLLRFDYRTINRDAAHHPSPPHAENPLGTDDQGRDVLARILYGFRNSVLFGLIVTLVATVIGVMAGAVQGYFGGWIDLIFQRVVEMWGQVPQLFLIMIIASIVTPSFWMLVILITAFSWTSFVGIVRAEFLRVRNFEYVLAAKALGVKDRMIIWRHILPNAMVATLTFLPFTLAASVSELAALDFLGFGLPSGSPSLGELALQARRNLQAPWLGAAAFVALALTLSLLVFIFEGVRDAFDPRKAR